MFEVFVWLFAIYIARFAYLTLERKLRIARGLAKVSGPNGVFLLGLLPDFIRNRHRMYDYLEEMIQKYGGRMKTPPHIFFDGGLYVTSPIDVKHILADNVNNYLKPQGFLDAFHELFQGSFFAINHGPHAKDLGIQWKLQRKIAAKVFTTKQFRMFTEEIFEKRAREILRKSKCDFDMQQVSAQYTLQSIFQIGFGIELENVVDMEEYVQCCNIANEHCASRMFVNQHYKWLWWCMPSEYRLKRGTKRIREIADGILQQRISLASDSLNERSDLLSLFIQKARDEEKETKTESLLTRDILCSIILTFIFAGRETTSECITYLFYALARNVNAQEKVREEILEITRRKDFEVFTYEDMRKSRYLDAVVHETLRLYPALPYNLKVAVKDDVLPDKTFVPAGTYMYYSPWYMGRSKEFWGEDALSFCPERWLKMEKRPTAFEFPVFQAGPRTCIGMQMAILEVKVFTAVVLSQYRVEIQKGHSLERDYVLKTGMYMKDGLPLHLVPLEQAQ